MIQISPILNGQTFLDAAGKPLRGSVSAYAAGSFSVKQEIFNEDGFPLENPIALDSSGRIPVNIYLKTGKRYNLVLRGHDNEIRAYFDNIFLPEAA